MRNIPTQETATTELSADEFNDIPGELENAITSTGQTLTSSDLYQIAKAMAAYGAAGDFYTDSGTANAKVLTPIGNRRAPSAYSVGQRIRFKNAVLTTLDAVTARIGALAAVPFADFVLANGQTPSFNVRALSLNEVIEAVYLTTPDGLTPYFFVNRDVSLTDIVSGGLDITVGNKRFQIRASGTGPSVNDIQMDDSDTDSHMDLIASSIKFRNETDNNHVQVLTDFIEYAHSSYGTSDPARSTEMDFDITASGWDADPTAGWYSRSTNKTLDGIATGTRIKSVSISFDSSFGAQCGPVACQFTSYLGWVEIAEIKAQTWVSPAIGTSIRLHVVFDPTDTGL